MRSLTRLKANLERHTRFSSDSELLLEFATGGIRGGVAAINNVASIRFVLDRDYDEYPRIVVHGSSGNRISVRLRKSESDE